LKMPEMNEQNVPTIMPNTSFLPVMALDYSEA
jgi:hypothetical protein